MLSQLQLLVWGEDGLVRLVPFRHKSNGLMTGFAHNAPKGIHHQIHSRLLQFKEFLCHPQAKDSHHPQAGALSQQAPLVWPCPKQVQYFAHKTNSSVGCEPEELVLHFVRGVNSIVLPTLAKQS